MSATKHKPKQSPLLRDARRSLALNGYTQKDAAKSLKVSETHLSLVLNGHRESASLLRRIHALPENPDAKW